MNRTPWLHLTNVRKEDLASGRLATRLKILFDGWTFINVVMAHDSACPCVEESRIDECVDRQDCLCEKVSLGVYGSDEEVPMLSRRAARDSIF